MGGIFPQEFDAIKALPGIGDYTAGAIVPKGACRIKTVMSTFLLAFFFAFTGSAAAVPAAFASGQAMRS